MPGPIDSSFAGVPRVAPPLNDANRSYLPGSPERAELKARLKQMASERIDIPIVIGGKAITTGKTEQAVMPHDHRHVLADWHAADRQHLVQAIEAAKAAISLMMTERRFGTAGARLVMEEFLRGEEVSFLVFSDGAKVVPMVSCWQVGKTQLSLWRYRSEWH